MDPTPNADPETPPDIPVPDADGDGDQTDAEPDGAVPSRRASLPAGPVAAGADTSTSRRRRVAVAGGVVLLLVAGWVVLGGGGSAGRSAGQTVSGFFLAQRAGDCHRLLDLVSEASWSQDGAVGRGDFLEQCAAATDGYDPGIGQVYVEIVDEDGVQADDGDRAVVSFSPLDSCCYDESAVEEYEADQGEVGRLVREGGEWKVVIDPQVLRIGRSIEETVRAYVEAYNEADCQGQLRYLTRDAWSEGRSSGRSAFVDRCAQAAARRETAGQAVLSVVSVEPRLDDGDDTATATATATAEVGVRAGGIDDLGGQVAVTETVDLVRRGLTWRIDRNQDFPGGVPSPLWAADHADLEARLLDEIGPPGDTCFHFGDRPLSESVRSEHDARGIRREYTGCDRMEVVTLRRFADAGEARTGAERMAAQVAADPPPTVEDLAETGVGTPEEQAAVAARYRPNQETTVPGMTDVWAVLTSCSVDRCSGADVFAARGSLVVAVQVYSDLGYATSLLQAQVEQL